MTTDPRPEVDIQGDSYPMRCVVAGGQLTFQFGDDTSGLQLHMDGEALATWLGLVVIMVKRIKALQPGQRADFLIKDTDIDKGPWALE